MKRSNFIFESVLMGISGLLGLLALVGPDTIFLALIWLFALGVLQLIHAIFLTINYWSTRPIRVRMLYYWIAVGFDFVLIFFNARGNSEDIFYSVSLVIVPLAIAAYLWLTTYQLQPRTIHTAFSFEDVNGPQTKP